MKLKRFQILLQASRPNQWIKNLVIFTSLIFSGQLFNLDLFISTTIGFVLFALLSSTSYILNDIIDYPYDRKPPAKKNRPIASGKLSMQDASFAVFVLSFVCLF